LEDSCSDEDGTTVKNLMKLIRVTRRFDKRSYP
jgi:hypothetical protein